MYTNAWCTSKVVVLLIKPLFFNILVAVASSDLKLSLNSCAAVSHLKKTAHKRRSPFNHFIITVQETIIVEAHIVSYTATAECIEDWTERNLHRDRFTDETTVCKRSVINQSNNNNDTPKTLLQFCDKKINFHKVNDIIIHLMSKIYIFFKINSLHWMKFSN